MSYQQLITENNPQSEEVQIAGETFYFLASSNEFYDLKTPIGYDSPAIETISKHGLLHIFKVENAKDEIVNEKISSAITCT